MSGKAPVPEELWRHMLLTGDPEARLMQRVFRHLPSSPRCKQCFAPFAGIGGRIARLGGFRPSRKNPNLCARCFEEMPPGGAEVDIAVLFADVRGSTKAGEQLAPTEFATLMNRFYRTATDVLVGEGAIIDKMIGDEVMALFIPGFAGADYQSRSVKAGVSLLQAVGFGGPAPWLPLGIGIHGGPAYVGNVGGGEVTDFTALGDTVNTAARIQAEAKPGEIVMSDIIYRTVEGSYPDLLGHLLTLRGRSEPVHVHTLTA